jgi:hypothetical protein
MHPVLRLRKSRAILQLHVSLHALRRDNCIVDLFFRNIKQQNSCRSASYRGGVYIIHEKMEIKKHENKFILNKQCARMEIGFK